MSKKREECRTCGAKLRHDKTSSQYDPEYCSGKCRKEDGAEPYVRTPEEQAMVVKETKQVAPASYADYMKNVGGRYVRRFEPEKLNWGNPMNDTELLQAGFRANREPLPGDWDYQSPQPGDKRVNAEGETETYVEVVEPQKTREPSEWDAIRHKAKSLGIQVFGKKREEVEAEIKEKENV